MEICVPSLPLDKGRNKKFWIYFHSGGNSLLIFFFFPGNSRTSRAEGRASEWNSQRAFDQLRWNDPDFSQFIPHGIQQGYPWAQFSPLLGSEMNFGALLRNKRDEQEFFPSCPSMRALLVLQSQNSRNPRILSHRTSGRTPRPFPWPSSLSMSLQIPALRRNLSGGHLYVP